AQLGDRRPQVVHYRRWRGAALYPDRAYVRRPAQGPERIPVRRRPARLAHRTPHSHHGPGRTWRALRTGIRRSGNPRRKPSDGSGRRPEAHADPARSGAAYTLHALAGAGAPGDGNRRRVRGPAQQLRPDTGPARRRAVAVGRCRHADRNRPPAYHARRRAAGPGRLRSQRDLHGQDRRVGNPAQGGRYGIAIEWRARLLERYAGRMDIPLRAPGAPGRRRVRGAQDGAGPLLDGRRRRVLALGRCRCAGRRCAGRRCAAQAAGMTAQGHTSPTQPDWLPALGAYLQAHGLGHAASLRTRPLSGGQSNPTYLLHDDTGVRVLRKQPPGTLLPSAHAIDREYRVMKALAGTAVPVPRMLHYCDDRTVIGTPFYLMGYAQGRVFMDPALPGLAPAQRRAIYAEAGKVLAALHAVAPGDIGLADYGRAGDYYARQVARWTRQYRDTATGAVAAMDALMDWLPRRLPPDDGQVCLVHGDYRIDNLVFDADAPRAIALLDWELSTLGHPLADLAYHCMCWRIPPRLWRGIGGLDLQALGIPDE